MQRADICIIGAGLSGLALGHSLLQAGRSVLMLECRDRAGGRILSQGGHDLGPAWIWPHNRRMLALLAELRLQHFSQYATGRLVFEDASGVIRNDLTFATMGGALRVDGGLAQVTDRLASRLGDVLRLGVTVRAVDAGQDHVTVTTDRGVVQAAQLVLALPPRLAAGLGVPVPDVPTWMAAQAKLLVTYATPFWRAEGLNGDAMSHRGPLVEIHDASPNDGSTGALFGFARPGAAREAGFQEAARVQLVRLFGPKAGAPVQVMLKDWATDPATATRADWSLPRQHPTYRRLPPRGRIIFAGTEVAPEEGGFLEGALASADAAFAQLGRT